VGTRASPEILFAALTSALQADLATLSANQTHQTIEEASHASLAFNPQHAQVVSAAILQVVDAVRTGQPLQ